MSNGQDAIDAVVRLAGLDVAVLDMSMPVLDGIQVLLGLREGHPRPEDLIFDDPRKRGIRYGGDGLFYGSLRLCHEAVKSFREDVFLSALLADKNDRNGPLP